MPDTKIDRATAPRVSVLIPSYNHQAYVEAAIRSVFAQDYGTLELIVIDDCSKDDTAHIAEALSNKLGFVFHRNDRNLGLNGTLDKALSLSTGDYVSILASDDELLAGKISAQVALLERSGTDAVYGTSILAFDDGRQEVVDLGDLVREFEDGSILKRMYTDSSHGPLLQSALIKRECLIDLASERGIFKSDDWVMLIRLIERYTVAFENVPRFLYRQHDSNTYKDYWGTLPMRVEVIALVTPENLRPLGLANMFRDQAQFLFMDGKTAPALKFLFASMALNPSLASWARLTSDLVRRMIRRTAKRLRRR